MIAKFRISSTLLVEMLSMFSLSHCSSVDDLTLFLGLFEPWEYRPVRTELEGSLCAVLAGLSGNFSSEVQARQSMKIDACVGRAKRWQLSLI